MRSSSEQQESIDGSSYHELQVLEELEKSADVSQRQLSQRVGIALGLTNTMVRNLVKKGYVRANQASWKRWVYALTPEGFTHKLRLTVAYIHRVMDHYRTVRQTLREDLAPLALHQESRVAIYGTGEFAELVYLGLREIGIEEIDMFAPGGGDGSKFLAMPVKDARSLRPDDYDRVLVAILNGPEELTMQLTGGRGDEGKIVVFFPGGHGPGANGADWKEQE